MSDNFWSDAELISVYTRAQALEDGELVDLNHWIPVSESGYKWPVACTSAVWSIIERAVNNKRYCNDFRGVIWDILWMSQRGISRRWDTGAEFIVIITGVGRKQYHQFKIECGPGDDGEPVLTVMLPDED